MITNGEAYQLEFTKEYDKQLDRVYSYISEELYAESSAKQLLERIEEETEKLKHMPKIYPEADKYEGTKRAYRKIVIDNYVVLYTIDEKEKKVYIAHIFYSGSNYINKI
jgi:addiction module RelE/StbE family toxin